MTVSQEMQIFSDVSQNLNTCKSLKVEEKALINQHKTLQRAHEVLEKKGLQEGK